MNERINSQILKEFAEIRNETINVFKVLLEDLPSKQYASAELTELDFALKREFPKIRMIKIEEEKGSEESLSYRLELEGRWSIEAYTLFPSDINLDRKDGRWPVLSSDYRKIKEITHAAKIHEEQKPFT